MSHVVPGAAAPSPSTPHPRCGVDCPRFPGEHRDNWKGGEAGGIFLPWSENGLPRKQGNSRGKSGQGRSFQQHANVLLASLIRPPITDRLSTGKSPGGQASQHHPGPLLPDLTAQLGGEDSAVHLNPQVCKGNRDAFIAWLQKAVPALVSSDSWGSHRTRAEQGLQGGQRGAARIFPGQGKGNCWFICLVCEGFPPTESPACAVLATLSRTRWL